MRNGRLDALDDELGQGAAHAREGLGAGRLMDEQLGHQRIVVRRHAVAGDDVRVEAHAGTAGRLPARDQAGRRAEVGGGVLGVDAALDGAAAVHDVLLREAQLLAGGDADLLAHQVDAGDQFRDRMLDLDAGVDLDEVEVVVLVDAGTRRCRRCSSRPSCASRTAASQISSRTSSGRFGAGDSSTSF